MSLVSIPSDSDEVAFAGGLSDPNTTHYKHRRHVLDIVNSLHSHGLHHQLDLPQIAVVGSQSVGKSSLIESISGITLPRAKGTCTRCPIECRLSKVEADWSCEVYLRQSREIQFGSPITDKSEIEERIRRAQLAILNPSREPLDFLRQSPPIITQNELSFSRDLISVRISGRDVDDLSFVDLPGMIQSVRDGGREDDIEEVKDLVTSFIKNPSCLILLVVSCETDLENQGARRLAKQMDSLGDRTIPVLTKPDRIAIGEHNSWMRLLENKQERFKHGWHCVKQPDQQQLEEGISWDQGRKNEADFFKKTTPWSNLEDAVKSRLGTQALTQSLGTTLFELINTRLPGLLREIEEKLRSIKVEFESLPPKFEGDPVAATWKLITGFKKDVAQMVAGRPEDGSKGLIQIFRKSRAQFREAIFNQAPDFRPYQRWQDALEPPQSPRVMPMHMGPIISDPEQRNLAREKEELEPTGHRSSKTLVYLDEVLSTAQNAITRELPSNYPYAVKVHYVARFTKEWPVPAQQLFEKLEREFSKELRALVRQHFSSFSAGGLEGKVLRTVLAQLKICSVRAKEKMQECVVLEREEPVTSNEHYLADYKDTFINRYKAARQVNIHHNSSLQRLVDGGFNNTTTMRDTLSNLRTMGLSDANERSLTRLIPSDKAEDAIEIMAEVRAYYQVAFKRFVDNIPMIMDFYLLKGFDRSIEDNLITGLSLGDNGVRERCAEYLQEDPVIERKRQTLQEDLWKFEAALSDLLNVPGLSLFSDSDSDDLHSVHPGSARPGSAFQSRPVSPYGFPPDQGLGYANPYEPDIAYAIPYEQDDGGIVESVEESFEASEIPVKAYHPVPKPRRRLK